MQRCRCSFPIRASANSTRIIITERGREREEREELTWYLNNTTDTR